MPIMTNAEAFHYDFWIYATELWAMSEDEFLAWLNASCERERPKDMIVRCKDCRFHEQEQPGMVYCPATVGGWVEENWFCKGGERRSE